MLNRQLLWSKDTGRYSHLWLSGLNLEVCMVLQVVILWCGKKGWEQLGGSIFTFEPHVIRHRFNGFHPIQWRGLLSIV